MHTEDTQCQFSEEKYGNYLIRRPDICALNREIRDAQDHILFIRLVWKEILKRKERDGKEYQYWIDHMVFYMRRPEIRESAWRVFMNEAKKNISIYYDLISIYTCVPEFRKRIANRKMKKPEDVYLRLLCLIASDFPKFIRKVTKELEQRFFRDGKLTGTGKFELITIVRCGHYSKELKRWAVNILLEENLSDRELDYVYNIFPLVDDDLSKLQV
ncbi:MAG: hypothetical protein L3J07_02770 [Candidatus Magasanikbacteria bacterium]|nr:hypothetical protein [Candidatus Magasanikbacteria bacterium]